MRLQTAAICAILASIGVSASAEYAGIPQRDYREQTYLIQPVEYIGPVWYAGDGRVDTGHSETRTRVSRVHTSGKLPGARAY